MGGGLAEVIGLQKLVHLYKAAVLKDMTMGQHCKM
jgi:hypothetical protein